MELSFFRSTEFLFFQNSKNYAPFEKTQFYKKNYIIIKQEKKNCCCETKNFWPMKSIIKKKNVKQKNSFGPLAAKNEIISTKKAHEKTI